MTATTLSLNSATGTAAAFRAWGSGISAGLAAVGLVQTADAGQINWTTAAAPAAANTVVGYEIWRFADTLQATKPIYLKIEYGCGTNTGTPALWATVGTATDGAGNLTSMAGTGTSVTAKQAVYPLNTSLTAVTGAVYLSTADGSALGLLAWPAYSTIFGGMFFLVERTRDADGTPNSDGYIFVTASSGSTTGNVTWEQRHFSALASPGLLTNSLTAGIGQSQFQSVSDGSTLWPIPVFTGFTWRMGGPSKLIVVIGRGDVPANTSFTMTHYGAAHLFVSAGAGSTTNGPGWGGWSPGGSTGIGLNSFAMRMD